MDIREFLGIKVEPKIVVVSPQARKALADTILPQMSKMVQGESDPARGMKRAKVLKFLAASRLQINFESKNHIYNVFIRYKPIDYSDERFLAEMVAALNEWCHEICSELEKRNKVPEIKF